MHYFLISLRISILDRIATEPFYKGNCDNYQIHKANPNKKAT